MSFENGIAEEEIKKRLSFMGNVEDWVEIKARTKIYTK